MAFSYLFGIHGSSGFGSSTTSDDIATSFRDEVVGKTFLITGANTGIGLEGARSLLANGADVIIACRSQERMDTAAEDLRRSIANDGHLFCVLLDLGSLESIKTIPARLDTLQLPRNGSINVLLANAGVMMCPRTLTADGFEMQLGTNHFGHFALTNTLMPRLRLAASTSSNKEARVVVVSSAAMAKSYPGGIRMNDLASETSYDPFLNYGQSKTANALFVKELSRRLKVQEQESKDESAGHIYAFSLHPGVIMTELYRHISGPLQAVIGTIGMVFFKSIPQGAATSLYCCLKPGIGPTESGSYYADCNLTDVANQAANDMDLAKELWDESEKLTTSHL